MKINVRRIDNGGKGDHPHVLVVNPWIHDFAAYDFWARPMGILYLASILRLHGCKISYIDCLNRFHPRSGNMRKTSRKTRALRGGRGDGRGPYRKTLIPKPPGLENIPRNFSRYGIEPEWFIEDLAAVYRPDLILVTCLMTYWHGGAREAIRYIRNIFPNVPIVAGGIYATLCPEHAAVNLGADRVVSGPGEEIILDIVQEFTGYETGLKFDPADFSSYPYPALDLQETIPFAPLMTTRGCPFSCAYCASRVLQPKLMRRTPEQVLDEIEYWKMNFGVDNFAFYDDALLVDSDNHASLIFEGIIRKNFGVRFHTPNALHIREITGNLARLMRRAGLETIRLGLETAAFEERAELDGKVTEEQFRTAVQHLLNAGFKKNNIGAYLLTGLPDQKTASVAASIQIVKNTGITPVLAHYTPIPKTRLWKKAMETSRYNLESDPVYTNNAIFPCQREEFSWQALSRLKELANARPV